jgi:hypothetical protein
MRAEASRYVPENTHGELAQCCAGFERKAAFSEMFKIPIPTSRKRGER